MNYIKINMINKIDVYIITKKKIHKYKIKALVDLNITVLRVIFEVCNSFNI